MFKFILRGNKIVKSYFTDFMEEVQKRREISIIEKSGRNFVHHSKYLQQETVEICSRLTIKTTRLTSLKWFSYTPFSTVSLIERVFVYWQTIILSNKSAYFCLLNEAYLKKLFGESMSLLNTLFKIFNTVISLFGNVISRCQKEKFLHCFYQGNT